MKLKEIVRGFTPPKKPTVKITDELLSELDALEPGKVLTIQGRNGRKFVIIDHDDFEHVAKIGGMELRDPK